MTKTDFLRRGDGRLDAHLTSLFLTLQSEEDGHDKFYPVTPNFLNLRAYFKQSLQLHREQTFRTPHLFKKTYLLKCLTFSHSHEFSPMPVKSTKVQLHTKISYDLFLLIPSKFVDFHPCFRTSHTYKSYSYNCTIHLLQLQITFYNCRNCDQLHVKICPV